MAQTNWTTSTSTDTDSYDETVIKYHVDENGDPINLADVDADPVVQRRKVTRVSKRIRMTPADGPFSNPRPVRRWFRLASSAVAGDEYGDQSGTDMSNPAPITTGIASDLTALRQVDERLKLETRLLVNGDVES